MIEWISGKQVAETFRLQNNTFRHENRDYNWVPFDISMSRQPNENWGQIASNELGDDIERNIFGYVMLWIEIFLEKLSVALNLTKARIKSLESKKRKTLLDAILPDSKCTALETLLMINSLVISSKGYFDNSSNSQAFGSNFQAHNSPN